MNFRILTACLKNISKYKGINSFNSFLQPERLTIVIFMDNTSKFSGKAAVYSEARPSYPLCPPEISVDYVCAAQAFHWFDPGLFSQECKRILRPSGKVIILYNSRDANAVVTVRLAGICRRLCGGYKGMHGGFSEQGLKSFFSGGFKRLVFKNDLHYSRDLFVKRMLSASYAPAAGDRSYKPFTDELCNLFDEFSQNGILHMPNNTYMYMGDL